VAKSKEPVNPFYVLLVVIGTAFLVTACAYGLMAARAAHPGAGRGAVDAARPAAGEHPLLTFLDGHGAELLTWELIALGVATTAAMGLDRYRWRQQADRAQDRSEPPSGQAEN
jgi:hypothetical protein